MNKLVIVGNGFDLAHGLPTSYSDFIDDFWKCLKDNYEKEEIKLVVDINPSYYRFLVYNPINNFEDFISNLEEYCKEYNYKFDKIKHLYFTDSSQSTYIFKFTNSFFKKVNNKKAIENWVDIENLYYSELKKIVKAEKLQTHESDEDWLRVKRNKIESLNNELEQIKKLLIKYLDRELNQKHNFFGPPKIDFLHRVFLFEYLELKNGKSNYLLEFSKVDHEDLIKFDEEINDNFGSLVPKISRTTVFLNFNYTMSIDGYLAFLNNSSRFYGNFEHLQIHGRLGEKNNPINFGFGDEMDEDYKAIENIDDNEYLRNFKSFKYLDNSNYKNLLDFIDSGKFQVYIMGHSCGLPDRTLLNTIFEHKYCRSIKVFYHKYDWPKSDGSLDNFTNIVQNISRHFNDKKLMREKIVNKSLCQVLSQDIRFPTI